ncbi:MAG: hypothetical protein IT371_26555 [Deltaproteobacteria bacterium]|nr:hypothetical protein [Deltaproteobacteria bacterium]
MRLHRLRRQPLPHQLLQVGDDRRPVRDHRLQVRADCRRTHVVHALLHRTRVVRTVGDERLGVLELPLPEHPLGVLHPLLPLRDGEEVRRGLRQFGIQRVPSADLVGVVAAAEHSPQHAHGGLGVLAHQRARHRDPLPRRLHLDAPLPLLLSPAARRLRLALGRLAPPWVLLPGEEEREHHRRLVAGRGVAPAGKGLREALELARAESRDDLLRGSEEPFARAGEILRSRRLLDRSGGRRGETRDGERKDDQPGPARTSHRAPPPTRKCTLRAVRAPCERAALTAFRAAVQPATCDDGRQPSRRDCQPQVAAAGPDTRCPPPCPRGRAGARTPAAPPKPDARRHPPTEESPVNPTTDASSNARPRRTRHGVTSEVISRTLRRGLDKLAALQEADGSWKGDYGGPMFLLPMYVATCHIARHPIPAARRAEMIRYVRNVQQPDGSIGLHAEGDGCMFTSVLCYVALRLLDVPATDPDLARMRRWIHENGGPLGAASWGKFTLALLSLYDYEGLNPILPELWLLPDALPVHPSKLWCHCRQVYLPMAYLYGMRAAIPADEQIRAIRREIYPQPYESIEWRRHRDTVARADSYNPPTKVLWAANQAMALYEDRHPRATRRRAMEELLDHIRFEDQVTNYIRIGPVNAVLNTLVHHFREPDGEEARRSFVTLDQYIWDGHDGAKMNGYNSTALWDTAFAVQSILATPFADDYLPTLVRAHDYIRDNQVLEDVPHKERYFRHASKGGWPFSDRLHGWPITDCTAEGFKAAVALEPKMARPVPEELLRDAVRLLLSFQNADGGWATYELKRGPDWLELLNPSQVFGAIMVDYSYVECTSACLQALSRARLRFPGFLEAEIARAIRRGETFLRQQQRADGSFEGSWAVCFTYGTWFGVHGLTAAGAKGTDPAVERALSFLKARQNTDGGWGEHHSSCSERRYVKHPESQMVNTAWALSSLVRGGQGATEEARRAAELLIERQDRDGDWPRESIVGVFNKTALINYENYRRYFSIWALAQYARAGRWIPLPHHNP